MVIGPVRVHCISQEYWYLRRIKCDCGGEFAMRLQSVTTATPALDVIDVACQRCGKELRCEFDISSFYPGDLGNDERMAWLLDQADDEKLRDKLCELWSQARTPTMEQVLAYLRKLSEERDGLALEYLEAAITHFAKPSAQRCPTNGFFE